jgi:DNA-binding LacI/PurR family transcriptional regulator
MKERNTIVSAGMEGKPCSWARRTTRINGKGCFVRCALAPTGRPLKTVGIIHTSSYPHLLTQQYMREIMQGIGDGPGLDIQVYSMRGDGFVTAPQLADRHVDGVILLGLESEAFVEEFATWGVPGVLVDQVSEKALVDCVACDNEAAAQRAVEHLSRLGHRQIRYVAYDARRLAQVGVSRTLLMQSSDRIERREAAVRALTAVPGMRWDEDILAIHEDQGLIRGIVKRWQAESERATAFLGEGEQIGVALMRELTAQGVKVPEEVSVCVVARTRSAETNGTATGCGFDFVKMGRKAVQLLRRRCEEPATALAPKVYRIAPEWVEGSSVRGARA